MNMQKKKEENWNKLKRVNFGKNSLQKQKSKIEYNLFLNFLKFKDYYIIENNIKKTSVKVYNGESKIKNLLKKVIKLNTDLIFDKNKFKYYLKFIYFSDLIRLNQYIEKKLEVDENYIAFIRINFLYFTQLKLLLIFFVTFEIIYLNLNIRLMLFLI